MNKLSSAHKTLPFYTKVLVENPRNGKTVIVQVLDRGPFVANRVMDLSREAARQLGTLLGGVAWVDCIVVDEKPAGASPKSPAEPAQSDSKADPDQTDSEKPSPSAP
jgi:rare lipoprotein A